MKNDLSKFRPLGCRAFLHLNMKHENGDRIMHRLFVDEIVHTSTSEKLKLDSIAEYKGDFEITCEDLMTSFLGIEVVAQPGDRG
jgi:hypothetical protein